jgi:hypothetical protein
MPTYPYFHRGANGGPGTAEEECLLGQKAAGRKVLGEQIWDRKLGAGLGSALLSNMELVVASELAPCGARSCFPKLRLSLLGVKNSVY